MGLNPLRTYILGTRNIMQIRTPNNASSSNMVEASNERGVTYDQKMSSHLSLNSLSILFGKEIAIVPPARRRRASIKLKRESLCEQNTDMIDGEASDRERAEGANWIWN